jgi:hypothetical protein
LGGVLNTGYAYGNITDTMEVMKRENGKHMNTLEKYHMHKMNRNSNPLF